MPTRYDVIVVGAGPAGGTAARYAARRGLKVVLVDKRKEIGVPVQCGEYVAQNDEVRAIFPTVSDLEDLMEVPYRVREVDTPVIRIWSPAGRRYDIPFRGFTVRRDKMDQGIAAQAETEGAEVATETTVLRVHGEGDERLRAGPGAAGADGGGQCDARRRCGRHGHGDERRGEQRGDDRGAARRQHGGRSSPGRHAPRRIRGALAVRRRRAARPRRADQAPRGPLLRERPPPRVVDGPPRSPADGACDPLPAALRAGQRQYLIAARSIESGTDGLSIPRRGVRGGPPRDGPQERTDFPPVRLRLAPARSSAVSDPGASRRRDVRQPRTPRPHGDDPLGHAPPGPRRRAHTADRRRRGPPAAGQPQDRGRGRLRRAVRRRRPPDRPAAFQDR